jgi:hypothetical protein
VKLPAALLHYRLHKQTCVKMPMMGRSFTTLLLLLRNSVLGGNLRQERSLQMM